jgi:hypothetical protein
MRKAATRLLIGLLAIGTHFFTGGRVLAVTVDFDGLTLGAESFWNGSDLSGTPGPGPWGSTEYTGSFTSGGAEFINVYNETFGSWNGFTYSNVTDNSIPVLPDDYPARQYSAFPGSGVGPGDDNYAVTYGSSTSLDPTDVAQLEALPYFELPAGMQVEGIHVTNTTYGVASMANGDAFAKKFGGPTGNDEDWFKLSVYGTDASGNPLPPEATAEFYLADFRFAENALDYIVDQWTYVDLSALADATRIYFNVTSSDNVTYLPDPTVYMNTPGTFAIDTIGLAPVPEPSSFALLLGAGLLLACVRSRRK